MCVSLQGVPGVLWLFARPVGLRVCVCLSVCGCVCVVGDGWLFVFLCLHSEWSLVCVCKGSGALDVSGSRLLCVCWRGE